ncbi:uncharacterized protein LOC110981036 isoform X1 [Acanthaster planci]|uniref:Uncharacterized protein LOC110981036 isoform X1 n=1 Tax=Acanthaster planci TaxID=133434 RepID=A0A8B7YN60_ACAPL|nr:uncharacterized protein LOC110981036 isoform X1 [Acanthaster planci]
MTEIVSQAELMWATPREPTSMTEWDQPPVKRPLSPDGTRRCSYKSQKSVSDVLGPEMAHVQLANDREARESPAETDALPLRGEARRLNPDLLAEAAALMDGGVEETVSGGTRVKDLIQRFEPAGQEEIPKKGCCNGHAEVEERISSSNAEGEESFLPGDIISKTLHKVKEVAKTIGNTVVEGVKYGVREVTHDIKEVAHRFRLPLSSLEEHPHNNIHVPHPDKSIGGMIGLGMNIQKAEKGHVVHTVIPDGLAAQSKLREKDVIVSVNGNDVKSWEFERLQQFFGSLAEVEIKIVVEREEEDESGAAFCQKLTLTFQLSLEGDQVIVDVAIKVGISGWKFTGVTGPYYIFQNNVNENTKFLTLKDNCFCMANVNDLTPCRFELVHYDPVINGPRAIVNLNNNSPLDHGEPTRIGENSSDLYGDHVNILTDDRVFFTMRQADSGKFTYELASRKSYFLTVDASGKLTTTYFPSREAVDWSGRFDMVATSRIDKMSPSEIEKFDGDDKTQNLFDREKPVNKWK